MPRTLVVHGGAGSWPDELRDRAMRGLELALDAGMVAFGDGPLAACVAAVRALEDDPIFNAGIGATFNAAGQIEHDAAVMEGSELRAGAVGAVRGIRHPVDLAREVMADGRHVLLVGDGARLFAAERGVETADEELFTVAARREQLETWKRSQGDTVGAVAWEDGRTAVAVSTGGYTGKRPGRVGDSPIPGAGLYAEDGHGAACSTGMGEGFMRLLIAFRATEAMAAASAQEAAESVIRLLGARVQGSGGVITVDREGRAGAAFNTAFMPWRERN